MYSYISCIEDSVSCWDSKLDFKKHDDGSDHDDPTDRSSVDEMVLLEAGGAN